MGLKLEEKMILGCVWLEGGIFLFSVGVRGGLFLPRPTFFRGLFFLQLGANMGKYPSTPLPPAPTMFLFRVFLCKQEDIFSYKLTFFFNVIGGHESKFIQTPFSIHSFFFSTKKKSFPPPTFQSPPFSIPHFSIP